jgi:hypothetical protein
MFEAEYEMHGHSYRVYQDDEGKYHVDKDERKDIHGPMPAESLINWMSNVINGLSYALEKANGNAKAPEANEIVANGGFNTGRLYTALGQRISWAQRADGWLGFVDHDRMISGWIKREDPIGILSSPIEASWLMHKYDNGKYKIQAPEGWTWKTPKDLNYPNIRL